MCSNLFNSAWGEGGVRYHLQVADNVAIIRPYSTSHSKHPHAVDSSMSNQIIVSHLPNVKQDILQRLSFAKLDNYQSPIMKHKHIYTIIQAIYTKNRQSILKIYSGYAPALSANFGRAALEVE